jgi:putative ABC transport system substrate-binding protein
VGRIIKGANSADLLVQLSATLELVINTKTGRSLSIEVPRAVLPRADEVIE